MSAIFAFILGILLAVAFFFIVDVEGTTTPEPVVTVMPSEFALPAAGNVIESVVNVGPLPPEHFSGYEIAIDVAGRATITAASEGTPTPATTVVEIGTDGLQQLLTQLDALGYFGLPTRDQIDPGDVPIGGNVSNLTVTLADRGYEVEGAGLQPFDRATLDSAQALIAQYLGFDPSTLSRT